MRKSSSVGRASARERSRSTDTTSAQSLASSGSNKICSTRQARSSLLTIRVLPGARAWGLAAQLYSLRRLGDGGIGDTGALSALTQSAARHGADAVAISPTHAGFAADPGR